MGRISMLVPIALTACTVVKFQAPRSNFSSEANARASCVVYEESPGKIAAGIEAWGDKGWRVMQTGTSTTSFLWFASHQAIVCYETVPEKRQMPAAAPLPPPRVGLPIDDGEVPTRNVPETLDVPQPPAKKRPPNPPPPDDAE